MLALAIMTFAASIAGLIVAVIVTAIHLFLHMTIGLIVSLARYSLMKFTHRRGQGEVHGA